MIFILKKEIVSSIFLLFKFFDELIFQFAFIFFILTIASIIT